MEPLTAEAYAELNADEIVARLKDGELDPIQVRELEAARGDDARVTVTRELDAIAADPTHPSTYATLSIEDVQAALDAGTLTIDDVDELEGDEGRRVGIDELIERVRAGDGETLSPEDELAARERARVEGITPIDAEPTERRTRIAPAPSDPVVTPVDDAEASGRHRAPSIDPRLVEDRDALRAAEDAMETKGSTIPSIDPRLVDVRDRTREREAELAERSTTAPPARS